MSRRKRTSFSPLSPGWIDEENARIAEHNARVEEGAEGFRRLAVFFREQRLTCRSAADRKQYLRDALKWERMAEKLDECKIRPLVSPNSRHPDPSGL
jgi:hypothetical protein